MASKAIIDSLHAKISDLLVGASVIIVEHDGGSRSMRRAYLRNTPRQRDIYILPVPCELMGVDIGHRSEFVTKRQVLVLLDVFSVRIGDDARCTQMVCVVEQGFHRRVVGVGLANWRNAGVIGRGLCRRT